MRSILILLFVVTTLFAQVHRITVDDTLRGDYFYTIATMVEKVPELDVRVLDGTDTEIIYNGIGGIEHGALDLYVNGVKSLDFQDGITIDALRPYANNEIDTIIVYTGISTVAFPGSPAIVIDVKLKEIERPYFKGMTYVGSEIGDPAIYLHLLDGPKPYNKEQLASGELTGGFVTGRVAHRAGFIMTYMDRYSNGMEEERAIQFGERNATMSLCEVRKGNYASRLRLSDSASLSLHVAAADYNLFRRNPVVDSYNLFTGRRGALTLSSSVEKGRISLSMGATGSFEEAFTFESGTDSVSGRWGGIAFQSQLLLKDLFTLSLMGDFEHGDRPLEQYKGDTVLPLNSEIQLLCSRSFRDSLFTVAVGYPLKSSVTFTPSFNRGTFQAELAYEQFEGDLDTLKHGIQGELSYAFPLNKAGSISFITGYNHGLKQQFTNRQYPWRSESGTFWGVVTYGLKNYLTCDFYGSRYLLKGNISTQFSVRGLTFGGGATIKSNTYWNKKHEMIALGSPRSSSFSVLDANVKGQVRMTYGLFKEHLRVAVAVRDIGKITRDLPQGSLVGPVIVSNIMIQF